MRPEKLPENDIIDSLVQAAWENPSAKLEYQLMAIPMMVALVHNRRLERLTFILNAILLVWGVALVVAFWHPLEKMITTFSNLILGYSITFQHLLSNPLTGLLILVIVILGWRWLDIDKHKRSPLYQLKS